MNCRLAIASWGIALALLPMLGNAQNQVSRDEEIGRYTAATRGGQQLTYKLLDYCAQSVVALQAPAVEAREGWDQRNLPMVSAWRDVVRNWLRADGVSDAVLESELTRIEAEAEKWLAALGEAQDAMVKAIAIKPAAEQARSCGLLTGLVAGRGRDIRALSPTAVALHERYAGTQTPSTADPGAATGTRP